MAYIDKIKKDGIIYDIKGQGGSGGDTPDPDVNDPGAIIREHLEAFDPEAIEKFIGESQD